jgi:hypothetical protein
MALPDPLDITVGADTISLPRITDDGYTGTYISADQNQKLTVNSAITSQGRLRSTVRLDTRVVAENPLTSILTPVSGSVLVIFDYPSLGFDTADKVALYKALQVKLQASTDSILKKILELQH